MKKEPIVTVRKVPSADLDAIEKAVSEGFKVEATIGGTVLLVKENY